MKKHIYKILFLVSVLVVLSVPIWAQGNTGENPDLVPKGVKTGYDESSGQKHVNYSLLSRQKEAEVDKLVELYHDAPLDEKKRLKEQIAISLNELFELNVRKREAEIKALEAEINDVERGLEFRKRNKTRIVEKRLRELLSE